MVIIVKNTMGFQNLMYIKSSREKCGEKTRALSLFNVRERISYEYERFRKIYAKRKFNNTNVRTL